MQVVLEDLHVHPQPPRHGLVEPVRGVLEGVGERRQGLVVLARERLHDALPGRELEPETILRVPRVRRQQREAVLDVLERRAEGRGLLGAGGGLEVQARDLEPLGGVAQEIAGAVEVVHRIEQALVVARREPLREEAADPQVKRGPLRRGDHRVRGLLDLVVDEAIPGADRGDEPLGDGGIEARIRHVGGALAHDAEHLEVEATADRRGELERLLGLARQPREDAHHEVDHVVAVGERVDLREVPAEAVARLEGERAVLVERLHELLHEERLPRVRSRMASARGPQSSRRRLSERSSSSWGRASGWRTMSRTPSPARPSSAKARSIGWPGLTSLSR